jgi:ribosome biogenesis GTPase / thiamine phosphate phosphatase
LVLEFSGLRRLGWDSERTAEVEAVAEAGDRPARIARIDRGGWVTALDSTGEVRARQHPRFRRLMDPLDAPAVGDWALFRPDPGGGPIRLELLLPRRTAFVRTAGDAEESRTQVIAANVDVALVVVPIDSDVNLRRVDRLVSLAFSSGATPVLLLSKADACPEPHSVAAAVRAEVGGVDTVWLSARTGLGLDVLDTYVRAGVTLVLVGASGSGKSTLANRLAGRELLDTAEVRADGRGRHTTTHRQLVELPGGALLIDTPGLRSIGMWDADEAAEDSAFEDVEELMASCRFGDCSHTSEPGCAVAAALADGSLDPSRWQRYRTIESDREERAQRREAVEKAAETRRSRAARARGRRDER